MEEVNKKNNFLVKLNKAFNITIKILGSLVLIFLICVLCSIGYSTLIEKKPLPQVFGYSYLVVASGSMEETIQIGDIVVIQESNEYKIGDIITFFPLDQSVTTTHRIVKIEGDKIYTKGDANPTEDLNPISQEQIVGKVVKIVPKVGLIIEWFKTSEGLTFSILSICLIVAFVFILKK